MLSAEILYRDDIEVEAILPGIIAAVIGYTVFSVVEGFSPLFGFAAGTYQFLHPLSLVWYAVDRPDRRFGRPRLRQGLLRHRRILLRAAHRPCPQAGAGRDLGRPDRPGPARGPGGRATAGSRSRWEPSCSGCHCGWC